MKYIADFFAVFIFVTKLNTKTSEEKHEIWTMFDCFIFLFQYWIWINLKGNLVISHETEKKQVKCFNLDSDGILMCWQLFGSWTDWWLH